MRFSHPEVKFIQFSPSEKYLVTSSVGENPSVIFWDVRTGKLLRQIETSDPLDPNTEFKWSSDDKYCVRKKDNGLAVYELPSMQLVEKKTFSVDGIKDFSWSPSEPLLAYVVVSASNDVPSTARVFDFSTKKEKVTKNFFKVKQVKFHFFHPQYYEIFPLAKDF